MLKGDPKHRSHKLRLTDGWLGMRIRLPTASEPVRHVNITLAACVCVCLRVCVCVCVLCCFSVHLLLTTKERHDCLRPECRKPTPQHSIQVSETKPDTRIHWPRHKAEIGKAGEDLGRRACREPAGEAGAYTEALKTGSQVLLPRGSLLGQLARHLPRAPSLRPDCLQPRFQPLKPAPLPSLSCMRHHTPLFLLCLPHHTCARPCFPSVPPLLPPFFPPLNLPLPCRCPSPSHPLFTLEHWCAFPSIPFAPISASPPPHWQVLVDQHPFPWSLMHRPQTGRGAGSWHPRTSCCPAEVLRHSFPFTLSLRHSFCVSSTRVVCVCLQYCSAGPAVVLDRYRILWSCSLTGQQGPCCCHRILC